MVILHASFVEEMEVSMKSFYSSFSHHHMYLGGAGVPTAHASETTYLKSLVFFLKSKASLNR